MVLLKKKFYIQLNGVQFKNGCLATLLQNTIGYIMKTKIYTNRTQYPMNKVIKTMKFMI